MKFLKFSEYRISYAREIVAMRNLPHYRGEVPEYIMTLMYMDYLATCGFLHISKSIGERLVELRKSIDGVYNDKYNQDLIDNINNEIDKLCII
jgi:hypothetical protein